MWDECKYMHPKEDCQTHQDKGICEDRQCEQRHRRYCRYFNNASGCYRGDQCQYLHSSRKKSNSENMVQNRLTSFVFRVKTISWMETKLLNTFFELNIRQNISSEAS